jgi:adenine phosphoribosyltransferase
MRKPALTTDDLARAVRNISDFPQPGIQFKDITPVLADPELFAGAIDQKEVEK